MFDGSTRLPMLQGGVDVGNSMGNFSPGTWQASQVLQNCSKIQPWQCDPNLRNVGWGPKSSLLGFGAGFPQQKNGIGFRGRGALKGGKRTVNTPFILGHLEGGALKNSIF